MRREMIVMGFIVLSLGTVYLSTSIRDVQAADKKKLLRVGVYDSRGIAIAYANSAYFDKILKEKQAALEQAKKENDVEKVNQLENWGSQHQAKLHRQGFDTAPVHEYLEVVKDKIPAAAKEAGVDMIVSKWETDYLAADADVVDVTMDLAKLFEPREKAYQWIEQIKDKKPISAEELERLEKENPNF